MGCCEAEFPDLRGKTEAVVVKLLTANIGRASSWKEDGRIRKTHHNLGNMLMMLKRAAIDPCDDRDLDVQEWHGQVLRARKTLFLKLDNCAEAEEFPFRKRKRRSFQNLSSAMVDRRNRRSKRLVDLEKFGEILSTEPSTRIPIGRHAQADVPEWIGPIGSHTGLVDDLDDSRWLGTLVCPLKWNNTVVDWESIYKRRDSCGCVFPGSIECVKLHVRKARNNLQSILGRTFFDWRFHQMGEEVSNSWTLKDQMKFDEIVMLNPDSAGKSFWIEALKHFTNKSKKDIVSYYFNVYVLRWIRRYTRLKSEAADGDDNINDEDSRKALDYLMHMKDSEADDSKHSNRRKSPYYYEDTNSRDLTRIPLFRQSEERDEVILSTKLPSSSSQHGLVAFDIGTTMSSREDVEAMEQMNPVDVAHLSCRDSMIAYSRAHFVAHSFLTLQQEYKKLEGKYETTIQSLEVANKKFNDICKEWSVKESTYLSREEDLLRQIAKFQIQREKARQATLEEREGMEEAGIGGMKLILEILHERGFTVELLSLEDVCPELFSSTSDSGMGQPTPNNKTSSESGNNDDK